MKRVTKNVFYHEMMQYDVVLEVTGTYPDYITSFKLKNGKEIGRVQDTGNSDVSYYFIAIDENRKGEKA